MTPVMAMRPGSVLRVSTDLMFSTPVSSVAIWQRKVGGHGEGGWGCEVRPRNRGSRWAALCINGRT